MIQVHALRKKIKKSMVLDDISFVFEQGKIYGLFGANGSGKTMFLRALSGLILPTTGEIKINNKILHKDVSFPPSIGVIIEHMELLPQYDAYKNLKILSKIKKVAMDADIVDAIKRVGLDANAKVKVRNFSLGMKQRLNIAQAIFEKPEILLLDEPTNAIDKSGVELIHQLLLEEKNRGALIIIATHHKDDIEEICDVCLRMENGRLYDE